MKKLIFAVLAFVLLLPFVAGDASAVKAQTYIDSMVTSNINTRRSEYVYKSRKHWRKKKPVRKKVVRKNVRKKVVRQQNRR